MHHFQTICVYVCVCVCVCVSVCVRLSSSRSSETMKKRNQLINKQQAFSAGGKKATAQVGADLLFELCEGVVTATTYQSLDVFDI